MTENEDEQQDSGRVMTAHSLASLRDEWKTQQAAMEAHLKALCLELAEPESPEARALARLLEAQSRAMSVMVEARLAAAEDLLLAQEAAEDFSRLVGSVASSSLPRRLESVARTLLGLQDEAAATLLTAQTSVAAILRAEQKTDAEALVATQKSSQGTPKPIL